MIAKLRGIVDSLGEDWVVIDVSGVGYLVYCSAGTLARLIKGNEVVLHIETHVREDHIHLFGFVSEMEREWFRLLTTVQGVGTRHGLAILSVLPTDRLLQVIAAEDKTALTAVGGVGPKLATRILNELKDKTGGITLGPQAKESGGPAAVAAAEPQPVADNQVGDAVSALVNLGYGRTEALGAVSRAARDQGDSVTLEELIRAGLAELAPREHEA